MPIRKDETLQRVLYAGHPPSCTCVVCGRRRLRWAHGYPNWFWLVTILLAPVGSIIVGFIAGFLYRRWVAGTLMIIIGAAIAGALIGWLIPW